MNSEYKFKDIYINIKFLALYINPILAFFLAMIRLKTQSSFIVLFLLALFFGASMSVPNVRSEKNNFDGIEYRINFERYTDLTVDDYLNNFKYYMDFTGDTDFFDDTIYFLVSRFTDNYHVMYMFLAAIFSILLLKTLKIFVSEDNYKNSICCFILLYLFLSNQIININMFRFYIALWLTVYSLFNLLLYERKRYLLFLVITPFIHASFFLLYLLLPLYLLVKHFSLLRCFFIISLFFSGLSFEFLQTIVEFLPDTIGGKVLSYTNEEYMYEINESGSGLIWIKRVFEMLTIGYINVLVLIMILKYKQHIEGTKCQSMFLFVLLLMVFVNITLLLPSVGSRFIMMALPFIAYIWLVCFSENSYNKYIYGLGCLFLFHAILPFNIYQFPCLRYYLRLWEPTFFVNSPFISFVKYIFLE